LVPTSDPEPSQRAVIRPLRLTRADIVEVVVFEILLLVWHERKRSDVGLEIVECLPWQVDRIAVWSAD
jgi:hypothetical protein